MYPCEKIDQPLYPRSLCEQILLETDSEVWSKCADDLSFGWDIASQTAQFPL